MSVHVLIYKEAATVNELILIIKFLWLKFQDFSRIYISSPLVYNFNIFFLIDVFGERVRRKGSERNYPYTYLSEY